MSWLPPLVVAIPLLAAAVVAGGDHLMPSLLQDVVGMLATATVCGLGVVLMLATERHDVVHWFGGWRPHGGVAIGIDFAADPLGAAMVVLAGAVGAFSLLYARIYLRELARLFDTLFLVICGAISGFALSGDLFNLFVWLELMGVAAYALTGFEVKQMGPLQGAINFSIVNTLGGYFVLMAVGLVYARTGALNLAQAGHALAGHKPDGLVVVALTLVVCGFLCKSAVVPFHLWLADAHAVAPAPVCVLFSGVMVELGLLAVARIYWTIFDAPFGSHQHAIRGVLIVMGIVTALLGSVMCFLQSHLKRLLAYSTISHAGIMLVGIAVLDSKALAGVAMLVIGHALVKGALFLCAGIVFAELEAVDELRLHGRGRKLPVVGVLYGLGAVGMIGLPYVGLYLGHAQIDEGATLDGINWVQPLLMVAAGISAGAILRSGARVFLGWGPKEDTLLTQQDKEDPPSTEKMRGLLVVVTAVMLALGLAVSLVPGLGQRAEAGADRFRDRAAYAQFVLHGKPMPTTPQLPFAIEPTALESIGYGLGGGVIALGVAAWGLWRRRVPSFAGPPIRVLKAAHSGIIGDYVTWIVVGTAVIGGVWAVTIR